MRCPICHKPIQQPPPGERTVEGKRSTYPFCSERCRLIDLGRWLDGSYQIPVKQDGADDDAADRDQKPSIHRGVIDPDE